MCSYEGNPTKAFASLSTVDTPLKFNMETQNKSLEKEILFWKPAFSGCILNFVCVYIYTYVIYSFFVGLLWHEIGLSLDFWGGRGKRRQLFLRDSFFQQTPIILLHLHYDNKCTSNALQACIYSDAYKYVYIYIYTYTHMYYASLSRSMYVDNANVCAL